MASRSDIIDIQKLMEGAIPASKFNNNTINAWVAAFGHVHRLKLYLVARQIMLTGCKFTPAVSEVNKALQDFDVHNSYWQPPQDAADERLMWYMLINGISDPYQVSEKVIGEVYAW